MVWDSISEKIQHLYQWNDGELIYNKKTISNYFVKALKCIKGVDSKNYILVQYVIGKSEVILEDVIELSETLPVTTPEVVQMRGVIYGTSAKKELSKFLQMQLNDLQEDGYYINTLGWHKIENKWLYCAGNQIFPSTNLNVPLHISPRLSNNYQIHYDDGQTEQDTLNQIRELVFLDHPASHYCLLYLIIGLLRTLFLEANVPPQFVLYINGDTGTFKTTLAKYFFDIYGESKVSSFASAELTSTAAAIEKVATNFRDCVFLLDDLSPGNTTEKTRKKEEVVYDFIRLAANCEARLKKSGRQVTGEKLQCSLAITAEYTPSVESVANRTILINMNDYPVNEELLQFLHRNPQLIRNFVPHFITWCSENADYILQQIKNEWDKFRDRSNIKKEIQRTVNSLYILIISSDILLQYLRSKNINTARIPDIFDGLLTKINQSQRTLLVEFHQKKQELCIGKEIVRLIQEKELYIVASVWKNSIGENYGIIKKGYLYIRSDFLREKINDAFPNQSLSTIKISRKLRDEHLITYESSRDYTVRRGNKCYYRIKPDVLAESAGLDIQTLFPKFFRD